MFSVVPTGALSDVESAVGSTMKEGARLERPNAAPSVGHVRGAVAESSQPPCGR